MSKIEVDTIDTQSSTTLQVGSTNTALIKIGTSGDTVEYPAGTTFTQSGTQNVTAGGAINVKSGGNITIDSGATITNNGTATGFSADLTNLNATNLTSGTVPDARFPSVLPAVSGANLTNIAGQLQWQSGIITASTASVGNNLGYWVDTTSNACVITLPGSAAVGDRIILTDYARTWGTNSVTINPNSLKFQGNVTPQPVYNTSGQSVDIVYSGATKGWIPNSDDDVTFETPQSYDIEMLVIAGGGGGGGWYYGGGGGAGGYRTSTQAMSAGVALTVTVGDGGVAGGNGDRGTSGNSSSISGTGLTTITSAGGGGGGGDAGSTIPGRDGGSGGGGSGYSSSAGDAGSGNTPSTSPSQGNDGGSNIAGGVYGGGGGGGAGDTGNNSSNDNGATGGAGTASSITGSSVTRAGGGGGSGSNNGGAGGTVGPGGAGGGGTGGRESSSVAGTAGTANTGGGGGGAAAPGAQGGAGGKGVVILSMPDADYSGTTTGSPTVATGVSGKTVLTFNGSGSYTT